MSVAFTIEMGPERVIRGDFYPAKELPRGTVIICHGFKGFKDWGMFPYVARTLADRWDTVIFNFSHNGVGAAKDEFDELEKFAHNTYSRELEDLGTVVRKVTSRTLVPEAANAHGAPVYLLGHSRGGGVCLIYAMDHPDQVSGVISWNGIANVDLFTDEQKEEMRRLGRTYVHNARTGQRMPLDKEILENMERHRERFDIVGRIGKARIPIALVQGSQDFEHLRQGSERLLAQNPSIERIIIPGGDHTFGARHPFSGTTEALENAIAATRNILDQWSQRWFVKTK